MYDREMKISPNFKLGEFTKSKKAETFHIDNHGQLNERVVVNLRNLCEHVLQPIRDMIEVPIHVSSGYRCPQLNKVCNGAARSQHTKGEAADIYLDPATAKGWTLWDVAVLIHDFTDFDQMIWETRQNGSKWIHVSYVTYRKNRHSKLRCEDGKTYKLLEL